MATKPTGIRGLIDRIKYALTRPETYRLATIVLRFIVWIMRIFDAFR